MTELEAFHTHLYPGARGRVVSGEAQPDGPVLLRFADGAAAGGTLAEAELCLAGYRTAAGTEIPPKRWRLVFEGDGFRVLSRA